MSKELKALVSLKLAHKCIAGVRDSLLGSKEIDGSAHRLAALAFALEEDICKAIDKTALLCHRLSNRRSKA